MVRLNWKSKCPLHLQAFEIFWFCFCFLLLHIFQYYSGKWRRKDRVDFVSQMKISQHWQNLLCLCQVSNSLKIKLGPELLQIPFSVNKLGKRKKNNQPNKTLNKEKKLSPAISVRAVLPNALEVSHSSSGVPCCQVAGNRGCKKCSRKLFEREQRDFMPTRKHDSKKSLDLLWQWWEKPHQNHSRLSSLGWKRGA